MTNKRDHDVVPPSLNMDPIVQVEGVSRTRIDYKRSVSYHLFCATPKDRMHQVPWFSRPPKTALLAPSACSVCSVLLNHARFLASRLIEAIFIHVTPLSAEFIRSAPFLHRRKVTVCLIPRRNDVRGASMQAAADGPASLVKSSRFRVFIDPQSPVSCYHRLGRKRLGTRARCNWLHAVRCAPFPRPGPFEKKHNQTQRCVHFAICITQEFVYGPLTVHRRSRTHVLHNRTCKHYRVYISI